MSAGAEKKPVKLARGQAVRRRELFDAEKRAEYLRLLRQGQSRSTAANLAGVSRQTVNDWLASGRSANPRHAEHVRFAADVAASMASHRAWAYKNAKKHAKEDPRSSISLLNQIDERFGGPQRVRALELANDKASLELRMLNVRLTVAEAAAKGGSEVPGFGLAGLLGDDELPLEVRQAVAQWAVRRGYVAVERLDWGPSGSGGG